MPWRKTLLLFLGKTVLIYGLLIAPWPGFNAAYGRYFRALSALAYSRDESRWIVRFSEVPASAHSPLDTRITLANRALLDANGKGPARLLDLDTRGVGWIPTALVFSLIIASPISWRRRGWSLLRGVLLVQCFILFAVGSYIANQSDDIGGLSLETFSPFTKRVMVGLEETFITQLGASFVVPVFIWLLVTFRREDFSLIQFARGAAERRSRKQS